MKSSKEQKPHMNVGTLVTLTWKDNSFCGNHNALRQKICDKALKYDELIMHRKKKPVVLQLTLAP